MAIRGCQFEDSVLQGKLANYRTRAIITRGLYIFYPIFSAVYNQERFILQTI